MEDTNAADASTAPSPSQVTSTPSAPPPTAPAAAPPSAQPQQAPKPAPSSQLPKSVTPTSTPTPALTQPTRPAQAPPQTQPPQQHSQQPPQSQPPQSQPTTAPPQPTQSTQPQPTQQRQHPPITAPLVQNSQNPQNPPRAQTPPVPTTQPGNFRTDGAPPQEYHYTSYPPQQQYPYPYYQQTYDYFAPNNNGNGNTNPSAPKPSVGTSHGPNDPFGMGTPPGGPVRKQPQFATPFNAPMGYPNAYSGPTGQYVPLPPGGPNSAPFNPLAPSGFPPLGPMNTTVLPPYIAGPYPQEPSGPKRKRVAPSPLSLSAPTTAGVEVGQPKRRRKAADDMVIDGDPFNFSKWTPSDDVLLKDCIQGAPSFEKIAKTVRFSTKFTAEQIKNRWTALLYDTKAAGEAAAAMAELPSINRRVLWSDHEENILRTEVHSTHFVSFQKVLEKNRTIFHSSRTAKSLEAHYYRMKRHGTLQKTNFASLTNSSFSQMEQSLYSSNDGAHFTDPDTLKDRQKQYRGMEKTQQRNTLRMEKELAREKDKRQKLLAIFRGRYLRHEMKSKEILLGRMSSDVVVDVDLSEEGNASKVSRQQAIIKLKRDCEFYIKNIGKRLIFINGKPLERGKHALLADSALIEIHNLQFIFEINKALINKIKKSMQS